MESINLKKYEYLSPRHFLEWNVMKYYKKNKLNFYEIGERYYAQNNFIPSDKEISISEFKENLAQINIRNQFLKLNYNMDYSYKVIILNKY